MKITAETLGGFLEKKETEVLMKDRVIAEKDVLLKNFIQMLHKSGLSPEAIAESLGEDVETVRREG